MKYTILITLWVTWCFIHSVMISLPLTEYLKKELGTNYRFYRLFYIVVALASLIPVILYSQSLKGQVLIRWEGYMTIVQILLFAIVLILFVAGGLKYDMLQFFGIRQITSGASHSALSKSGVIDTTGILSITRHPWYLATIIFIWIDYREMYIPTLIINILLTIYLITGTILEERKLIVEFGDDYRDYIHRVSMLFPTRWILSKLFIANNVSSADR